MKRDINPFGDADAARVSFDPSNFVEFTGRRFRGGLAMRPDDGEVRVIVGGKGAGKTIYLRRLQTGLSRDRSRYVDDWRNRPPATRHVLEVWGWSASVPDCRQRWSRLWRRAIMRSVVSHLLHGRFNAKPLSAGIPEGVVTRLRRDFPELLPTFEERSSIVTQVEAIIQEHADREALDAFLDNPRWEVLELQIIDALEDLPPVFFILDALDEEFESAPSQWLDCQVGLLKQVFELRSNQRFGSNLHVIIGVRDLVYSTTQHSEHSTRFHRTAGIRYLKWDRDAIQYFLHAKLRQLDEDEWMLDRRASDPVERWLGHRLIWNPRRQREELLEDYILRHTRLIPRDVIQMGNALCDCINEVVDSTELSLHQDALRRTVAEVSREAGMEQLYIVANHITADLMPREALKHDFADSFIDLGQAIADGAPDEVGSAHQGSVLDSLRGALGELGEDRITAGRLNTLVPKLGILSQADILSILWQHRLLGYVDGKDRLHDPVVFYGVTQDDSLELPAGKKYYALHSILIDAVDGLRGVGATVQL